MNARWSFFGHGFRRVRTEKQFLVKSLVLCTYFSVLKQHFKYQDIFFLLCRGVHLPNLRVHKSQCSYKDNDFIVINNSSVSGGLDWISMQDHMSGAFSTDIENFLHDVLQVTKSVCPFTSAQKVLLGGLVVLQGELVSGFFRHLRILNSCNSITNTHFTQVAPVQSWACRVQRQWSPLPLVFPTKCIILLQGSQERSPQKVLMRLNKE